MTVLNKHAELRKELSSPAIGSNHHLRKLALSLLEDLEGEEFRTKELESQRALAFMACNRWRDKCVEAEKRMAIQDDHINQQAERIESLEKKNGELGGALLEAREIVLPQRLSPEGYHIDEAYMVDDAEGEYLDRDAVIAAIRAAGIGVKGE